MLPTPLLTPAPLSFTQVGPVWVFRGPMRVIRMLGSAEASPQTKPTLPLAMWEARPPGVGRSHADLPDRSPAPCMNSVALLIAMPPWLHLQITQWSSNMKARPLTLLLQVFQDQGPMHSPRNQSAKEARPFDVRIYSVSNPICLLASCLVLYRRLYRALSINLYPLQRLAQF